MVSRFTWNVEVVLNLFRSWPYILSPKQLSIKVVTLLGLVAISRGAEIHQLDLSFLNKFHDRYQFRLSGTVKNKREGKKPDPIVFYRHSEDDRLCPIKCIDRYITMTEPWRPGGNPSAFFLSYVSPHKPITKSRLAGWVKEALSLAGVDTEVFSSHSIRGASSSRALLHGLSVGEVLEHGSWSRESTWQKFYHRKVDSTALKFQKGVLRF